MGLFSRLRKQRTDPAPSEVPSDAARTDGDSSQSTSQEPLGAQVQRIQESLSSLPDKLKEVSELTEQAVRQKSQGNNAASKARPQAKAKSPSKPKPKAPAKAKGPAKTKAKSRAKSSTTKPKASPKPKASGAAAKTAKTKPSPKKS